MRLLFALSLIGFFGMSSTFAQGLKNNTTYVVNGQQDFVAPVDTFANLSGPAAGPFRGAMSYLNQFGMDVTQTATGPVVFVLSTGYNPVEPGVINIGNPTGAGGWPNMFWNANSPITIRPALGTSFVISSPAVGGNTALVRLNAAWYVNIDGEAIPGQRNLTFSLSGNVQTTARVIDIMPTTGQRVQSVSIRNCNIVGGSNTTSNFTFAGIYLGGVGAASNAAIGQSQNITIQNNLIIAVQNGVYLRGLASTQNNQNKGIIVKDNVIGAYANPINAANTASIGAANGNGIYINSAANVEIANNTINNANLNASNFRGIWLNHEGGVAGVALDSNIQVTGNTLDNFNVISAGVTGIRVSLGAHSQPLRLLIANNSISRLASQNGQSVITGFAYPVGILIEDVTTNVGAEVYFNSVSLTGKSIVPSSLSACFATGPTTNGGIIMMNNSFANSMDRTTGAVGNANTYSVYNVLATGSYPFTYSSFNNYYTTTMGGGTAYIARLGAIDIVSLKRYRNYSRSDSTSYSFIPPFRNDSDLTVASGRSHRSFNTGAALTQFNNFYPSIFNAMNYKVAVDRFGTARSNLGRFTAIGSHLWAGDSSNSETGLTAPRVFAINGFTSRPTILNLNGSFATVAEAIDYLNHYGVTGSGNVVLEIQPGYAGETGYIPPVIDYLGSSVGVPVTLRTQSGFSTTLTIPNAQIVNFAAIIRIIGAKWFTVTGGPTNGLTLSLPPLATNTLSHMVAITPIDTASNDITIRNLNLIGNSTTAAPNTGDGIYVGNAFTIGNVVTNASNTISILSNRIMAVRSGIIVLSPNSTTQSALDYTIKSNIIGGDIVPGTAQNTTYIGGVANQSGIWVRGLRNGKIDSNIVRNCVATGASSNAFSGILLSELAGNTLSAVEVTRNSIFNLVTLVGNGTAGIRVNIIGDGPAPGGPIPVRFVLISNNYVGKILGNGAGANFNPLNPNGISVESGAATTLANIYLAHNTVHLSGTGLANNSSSSSCLYMDANVRGGVEMINNLFVNRMARTSTVGNRYAVLVGHTSTPFTTAGFFPFNTNNNNLFVGPGLGNAFVGGSNNVANPNAANINNWRTFTSTGFPGMDGNSFSWPTVFLNDTMPQISLIDGGLVPGGAAITTGICDDIYGNPRYLCAGGSTTVLRWVGALEFGTPFPALQGNVTYPVNGVDDPPTPLRPASGSFRTVRAAVNYLNSQGVDDPSFGGLRTVRFEIQAGYVGETDTFITPIAILDYPRMAPTRPVVLGIASGRNDTIQMKRPVNAVFAVNSSMIRYAGTQNFTIDGNNGSGRGITIMLPSNFTAGTNRVVDFVSGVSTVTSTNPSTANNALRNCNLVGLSTTVAPQTFAGVYFGGAIAPSSAVTGANNNNLIDGNFIGATQYGVYLRGTNTESSYDFSNLVVNNIIGGNIAPNGTLPTNFFGGIANAAGVFVMSQINASVVGNTIQNSVPSGVAPRGIELGVIPGNPNTPIMSSYVTISRNTIRNIATTQTNGAYGIYLDFGTTTANANRFIKIHNNMISGIASGGASRIGTSFANNPFGVYFNAGINIPTRVEVELFYNSINLGVGNSLTATNAISACVGIPSFINSGVFSANNIFQNRLGSISATTNNYAVAVGGTNDPFNYSNFNNYFAANQGTSVAANFASNASSATPDVYNQWFEIMNFTKDDTLSLTGLAPFTNDNNLLIPANTNSNLFQAGLPLQAVNTDLLGNVRNIFAPSIGAHEFSGNYLDNVSPRIFNITDPTLCQAGAIGLNFAIYDKQLVGDTLYYRINGGATQTVFATIANNTFRRYIIPAQTPGSIIEYRLVAVDFPTPPNTGVFPTAKLWDTLSTGIMSFPYVNGFEGTNNPIWTSQNTNGNGAWEIGVLGSNLNPPQAARSGLRSAMFRSSVMTNGASARLVSPCLNLSNMTSPTLRFYVSQNSDLSNKRDSIYVTVSYGGNVWSNSIRSVERVNVNFPLPGYRVIEVCLAEHRSDGIRLAIEGISSGNGQNIQIDDIEIFDDAQTQRFTPKVFNQCYRDSIRLTINNTDQRFMYRAFNLGTNQTLGEIAGNSANQTMGIFVPQTADTVRFGVEAYNSGSAAVFTGFGGGFTVCSNIMPDSVTAYINRYNSNPLLSPGLPFNGSFNSGNANVPDGAKVNDVITYQINPPSFYTNADFGTLWSLPQIYAYREGTGLPVTNFTYQAPTPSANGFVRYTAPAQFLDSNIVFVFQFRLNGSNCDTFVTRYLRIVNPPVACFAFTPSTNLCATNPIQFSGVCTTKPAGSFPFTFTFNYGDNTFAGQETPQPKIYSNPGTYTVRYTVTDRFGLSSEQTATITILPSPVVNFAVTVPCATDSTVFTPNAQPAGSTYSWAFHNFTLQTREVAKFRYTKFDTSYRVSVRVTNTAGCFTDAAQNVFIFAKPTASFSTNAHCLNTNVPITNTSTIPSGNMGYFWDWGNGATGLSATPTYKYPASGTFSATLKVSSAFGCVDSIVRAITVYDRPFAGFDVVNACVGDATQFNNTTQYAAGQSNITFTWNFGDQTPTSSDISPRHAYGAKSSEFDPFRATLLAVDKINGCRDSIGKNVSTFNKPIAQWSIPSIACQDNSFGVVNTSYTIDGESFKCRWIWGDGTEDSICNLTTKTYKAHAFYNPRLEITTTNGCKDTVTQDLTISLPEENALTSAIINLSQYPYCQNMRQFTASSATAEYYNWKMGDKFNTVKTGKVVENVFQEKGTYIVECTIKDISGCIVTDTISVNVFCSVGAEETLASNYSLTAYPNPFNNGTNLGFELSSNAENVVVTTLDMLGKSIRSTTLGKVNAGKREVMLDESYFGAAGAYLIKVEIDGKPVYKQVIKQ